MLTICVGPNGSGKTLWALHMIERFLLEDDRIIVTSVSVNIPRLNEYMQQKHGPKAPDVCRRVVKIDKEFQRTFWRVRGLSDPHDDYGVSPLVRGPFGDDTWNEADGGVIYVLDEIQTVFGARDWQKTGNEFVAYQSQHRKMGDDTIAISPASSLIEKQFRILCGECVVLANMYKLKIGIIKAPRKIVYRSYQNCPPLPGEDAMSQGNIYIDGAGLASCYRTEEGLGICGDKADKGRESKGFPFWAMFPAIGVACILVYFGFRSFMHWGTAWGADKLSLTKGLVPAAVGAVQPASSGAVSPFAGPKLAPVVVDGPKPTDAVVAASDPLPVVVAWCQVGKEAVVTCEDGSQIWGVEVKRIASNVVLDGVKYKFRPRTPGAESKSLAKIL